ncbi:MAG: ABC transporter permease [Armatimonadota bacterium]
MRFNKTAAVYKMFLANSFRREVEFKANFWAKVLSGLAWLLFFLLTIQLIYSQTPSIAGWTKPQGFMLMGTCYLMGAIAQLTFYGNLSQFPIMIQTGVFDFALVKPVNTLFWVGFRFVNLDAIASIIGSIGMLIWGGTQLGLETPGAVDWVFYLVMFICGLVIYFGMYLLMMSTAFWFVRVENLTVLMDMLSWTARFPLDIFRGATRVLLTYILPVAFLASLPCSALLGRLPYWWLAIGLLMAVFMLTAAIGFFRFAIRSYSSASS